jgi:hypothetical protein
MAEDDTEYPQELRVFVGLASQWKDRPEHRAALDADIREEARRVIETPDVPCGIVYLGKS